ncbi:ribonuclease HII, partial [bacterium]|nr:ribonuclease HII [bacterium]
RIAEYIKRVAIAYGIGEATPQEIDRDNILQATFTAMHRALDALRSRLPREQGLVKIVVDGTGFRPYHNVPYECVVGGDHTWMCIAAASILAKTHHDQGILDMLAEDPALEKYGLRTNMGYGTKAHMTAIQQFGVTAHHRTTFLRNVKSCVDNV